MLTHPLLVTFINLSGAFVLGGLIGFERQWRQRLAGLRTNTLVAVGSASFVIFASMFPHEASPTRVAAQIVSGIGFLGAGIIFKEGVNVRGLNTSATLWCSAAVGTLCGAGYILHAAIVAAFIVAVNALLRPLVRLIDRQPLKQYESSVVYRISVYCLSNAEAHVRALLLIDSSNELRIQSIESRHLEDPSRVEVNAMVRAQQRQDRTLEQIIGRLSLEPQVNSARWQIETRQNDENE